jgi:hypothetical protein
MFARGAGDGGDGGDDALNDETFGDDLGDDEAFGDDETFGDDLGDLGADFDVAGESQKMATRYQQCNNSVTTV